ncbi:hypothetical protein OC845_005661 [Tilletia horrida]|nr:hypothetical protein OC845_005661 [Tilletia horrida]
MATSIVRAMWLQSIMSRRLVTDKESRAIYNIICKSVGVPADRYREDLGTMQQQLSVLGLDLRQMQDEVDGRTMVGVVNAKADSLAEIGTGYTPAELVYIKAVIEAIYTAPRSAYSISSMEALALNADKANPITKKTKEELLANLVRHDWLRKSKGGRYTLGTRALMELQTYLQHEYEDNALQCFICGDLITMGHVCATDTPEISCSVQVHFHCENRLKVKANAMHLPGKCPECKYEWAPWPFGIQAAEEAAKRRPGFGAGEETQEAVEDDENFDDVDTQPTTSRRRKTGPSTTARQPASKKKKGKRRATEDDDDDDDEDIAVEDEDMLEEDDAQNTSSRRAQNASGSGAQNGKRSQPSRSSRRQQANDEDDSED